MGNFDHTFAENGGEGTEYRELTAKPSAPQSKNWKIYPLNRGWFQNSDANVQEQLVPAFGVSGHLNGARLVFNTVALVDVGESGIQSVLIDSTSKAFIVFTGVLTANLASAGAGGLDTGSETADTWYAVHVIGDTTEANAPAVLLSLSATAPTLPGTHDIFRRVGWIRNDGSSDILKFGQVGSGRSRRVAYDEEAVVLQVLSAGNATAFTDIDLSSLVPPTSQEASIAADFNPNSGVTRFAKFRGNGSVITNPIATIETSTNENADLFAEILTDTSQLIEYLVSNAAADVDFWVRGYRDDL